MGLFKFVKNAGASLFKKKKKEVAVPETVEEKSANAFELVSFINGLGLEIEDLEIRVDGEKVTVGGKTANQATREKVILAVGNVEGVSEVEDNIVVATPEPEAQFHTVVSGDSLSKIAKNYYGNAMKYPVIFEANKPMLTDPNKIYPGQVLRIPPLS
jgi:nucleoid-associated protein YgaU